MRITTALGRVRVHRWRAYPRNAALAVSCHPSAHADLGAAPILDDGQHLLDDLRSDRKIDTIQAGLRPGSARDAWAP